MSVRKVHAAMCPACEAGVLASRHASGVREAFSFFLGFVTASRLQRSKVDARDEATKTHFFCATHARSYRSILAMIDASEARQRKAAS